MIPSIVIQTWRDTDLPSAGATYAESWRLLNPKFEYRFYDDAACRALVAATVPDLLPSYDAFPHAVMRADFFRYAALFQHGGVYADIDMECVRPIDRIRALGPLVLGIEAHLTSTRQTELRYDQPMQLANCVMLSAPRHPFFMAAMRACVELWAGRSDLARSQIEDVTGPRMLTRLFYSRPPVDAVVLRQTVLTPPRHYPDLWPFNANVHARHHFFGTWKSQGKSTAARRWIERDRWPNPFGQRLASAAFEATPSRMAR